MRKLAAFITACVLILSTCAVGVSAAEYGRDVRCGDFTAQGEYIYGIVDNRCDIYRMNIVSGKKEIICRTEGYVPSWYNICISGNYLYYTSEYEPDFNLAYDSVYRVDIGSGEQTRFFCCEDIENIDVAYISGIITSGNRVYIQIDKFVHDEVSGIYNVYIFDTDGKCLKAFTPCPDSGINSTFIDAEDCDVCAGAEERKIIYTYTDDGDVDDWYAKYTGAYNIVKVKSDLSEERITVSAKVGKKLKEIVYCGKKYVYYIDKNNRLCRYNTETKKYAILFDGEVVNAYYKDGSVYFLTNGGELKKYKKSKISTLDENVSAAYFFNEYILYYDENASLENDIPKIISFKNAD